MTRTTPTPLTTEPSLEPPTVFDALNDAAARRILGDADEPRTAAEFSDRCDVPLSTTYRKLNRLADAGLLRESIRIRDDGHHVSRYKRTFDSLELVPNDNGLTIRQGADSVESTGNCPAESRMPGVSD